MNRIRKRVEKVWARRKRSCKEREGKGEERKGERESEGEREIVRRRHVG